MSYERYKDFRLAPDDNGCWSVLTNDTYESEGIFPSKAAAKRHIDDLSSQPSEELTVTIYEDWEEVDGKIYYKWRLPGDTAWHIKETPYKQKPIIRFKTLSKVEFEEFYGGENT